MAAASVSGQIRLWLPLKNTGGDLSIRGSENEPWVRLDSPSGDKKRNCYGVIFDGGITVIQENRKTRGVCSRKFVVDASPKITHDTSSGRILWVVEAKCLEVGEPEFNSKTSDNKARGIEDAKTYALAKLEQPVGFIKLDNMNTGDFKGPSLIEHELRDRMTKLMIENATPVLPVGGKKTAPVLSQQQSIPPSLPPLPLSQKPTISPSQDQKDEGKARQRRILLKKKSQLRVKTEQAIAQRSTELAKQRATAILALNAGYDKLQEEEVTRLRATEALEKEKVQRALDSL